MSSQNSYRLLKEHKSFSGKTFFAEHDSVSTGTKMRFSGFIPEKAKPPKNAIVWLSGLTCTEENFITKAGSQNLLKDTDTMILCPDTSPRGSEYPGEHESYDFGSGASFYVNARTEGYKDSYQMYDYISKDIVQILKNEFRVQNISISGHSMGGHGALILGLREPQIFKSVSAFSPIVHPTQCPWGKKAFKGYLGDESSLWKEYDTCELLKNGRTRKDKILIDQGLSDEFLENQLLTHHLETVASETGQKLDLRYQKGYDHSYYFISSFLADHIPFLIKGMNH